MYFFLLSKHLKMVCERKKTEKASQNISPFFLVQNQLDFFYEGVQFLKSYFVFLWDRNNVDAINWNFRNS